MVPAGPALVLVPVPNGAPVPEAGLRIRSSPGALLFRHAVRPVLLVPEVLLPGPGSSGTALPDAIACGGWPAAMRARVGPAVIARMMSSTAWLPDVGREASGRSGMRRTRRRHHNWSVVAITFGHDGGGALL